MAKKENKGLQTIIESKSERFIRLGKPRVQSVLKSIRILGNCANRSTYEYNEEQITKMFKSIRDALDLTESKFSKSKKEQEEFDF